MCDLKFEEVNSKDVKSREAKLKDYWNEIDLLGETFKTRENADEYVIYDGPPTANGKPGIHHVIARTLKDMTSRYKNMKGYKVLKKAGWDTHGLPVEIEVEKQLGFHDKNDIEQYGIEKFNHLCKESVWKYSDMWRDMSDRMAFLYDMDHPYVTMDNNYIETEWWLLDQAFKKGYIYEGAKVMPYCPRCGTGLASHEVAQGYEFEKTLTLTVRFKKKGASNEYFLAWTTTPWTLPSNLALAVNPDLDYVKVFDKEDDCYYYMAKSLMAKLMDKRDYEVVEEMKGTDLELLEYEQLMPYVKTQPGKAFKVILADYVSAEDGTGIVHIAPAFGEDDYQACRKYDLDFIQPVDLEGRFTETPWKGEFVFDTNEKIWRHLQEEGKVFAKETMEHNYPHCWRCHTPLIYYARPSWYIEMSKFSGKMVENNQTVNWFPQTIGDKRFGNWLENVKDWAISRSRYWGTPLNIWRCECGHTDTVASRAELKERAIEDISEDIELHRPYVDNVHIKCDKCGGTMTRVPDVLDVWFDSGAMPFAQLHYPFENKELFEKGYYPADFICEGIDQTRGWFYSLMAISTITMGRAPYKNVLVNDLVVDKNGQKMSKSRGNTLDPFALFDKYGADAVRFYSLYVSPAWMQTKFDEKGLVEVKNNFFRTFENVYNFFSLYAGTDGLTLADIKSFEGVKVDGIDRWLYSRLNSLIKSYYEEMENFEYNKVVHEISDFVVEDLSNWYIRRNRKRFWSQELTDSKKSVYKTTYDVLLSLSKLIAPITPFLAEEIYQKLTGGKTVHTEILPQVDESLIDTKLEADMDLVRKIVNLGRASREKESIKVRQPLSKIIVDGSYKERLENLLGLIKEELNVKEVDFEDDLSAFMDYFLKPDFRVVGRIFQSKVNDFAKYLANTDAKTFIDQVNEGPVKVEIGGEEFEVSKDYLDIRITAKEGFDVEIDGNVFVILDTEITEDLKDEGYAREFISKIQNLRKDSGFEVTDRINISYDADADLAKSLDKFAEDIKKETLADKLEQTNLDVNPIELNDKEIKISLERL
ncbi:isoleucine--tRNA ligase [Anaerococcus lactolyticus ATCC 51172]|uniref:Isoleucine--tRNA ligase n=1 Tax=Anaerococcus lactolyticus ATCC 51172 TaxID=525254 RepID=C2BEJ6_9FIRM|nr:isoleucine--tRNA ligase [Anaerococcus lactolyticus]EEI86669.1 isoleucine--tRNA ligase [Anaerococcus lactolyticus ATCC 51172]